MRSSHEFRFNRRRETCHRSLLVRSSIVSGSGGGMTNGFCGLLPNTSEPRSGRLALAGSNFEESFLNLRGEFAAPATADRNAIDGTNWGNLCRGAAAEQFVRDIESGALNAAFFDRDSHFLTDSDYTVARNTGQN